MSAYWIIGIVGLIVLLIGIFGFCFLRKRCKAIKGYNLLRDFDNRHAQESSKKTERAMSINATHMSIVGQHLKGRAICERVTMSGSAYEGLMIDEADNIQFQAMIIRPISESDVEVLEVSERPGYFRLKYLHGTERSSVFDRVLNYWSFVERLMGARYFDGKKTVDLIYEEFQNCIRKSKKIKGKVKLYRKDTVIQMDVYPDSWLLSWGARLYGVEIFPAYKLGEELYESRPVTGDKLSSTMIWHQSFALQERQKLCEGAKMILRVLEVLRKRDSDFGNFTSYQLKTLVLHETDANPDWSELMLQTRLADVLKRLEKCLAAKNLPHNFSPEINLLSKMQPCTMDHIRRRIKNIRNNESEILRLLRM